MSSARGDYLDLCWKFGYTWRLRYSERRPILLCHSNGFDSQIGTRERISELKAPWSRLALCVDDVLSEEISR